MYSHFASNFTHNDLNATRIITANSVHVYGFILSNADASARTVTLQDSAGTAYAVIFMPPTSNFRSDVPFLAAAGLTILSSVTDTDVKFTVFHSNLTGAA